MKGGPWTQSMKVVHGPGPQWGSMDPWSMFCPHPADSVIDFCDTYLLHSDLSCR